jgi:chitinase
VLMRNPASATHLRTLRRLAAAAAACVTAAATLALTTGSAAQAASSHRVVVYYQTQYSGGTYVSPLGLTNNNTGVTDVEVGAIHLDANSVVHLNDTPPSDPTFDQMWADLAAMQAKGVRVNAFIGGAAAGSFQRLDTDFATYYPLVKNLITTYHLDGVDLDVEESMSLTGIERLIDQLRTDFGTSFVITLAPVVPDLNGGSGLSGFNYDSLYAARGSSISWFNTQFYCGWGSLANTSDYDSIMRHGTVPADKVVAGVLTNPANCGSGYVDVSTLSNTLKSLIAKYPAMGGVSGWEYFNSLPGGASAPWQWAANVNTAMNGGGTGGPTDLALNKTATGTTTCNGSETPAKAVNGSVSGGNSDKFCSLTKPSWLKVDLGATHSVTGFEIDHASAGGESTSYNTKAYTLQTSTNGTTWTTVVTVTNNTAGVTTHTIAATNARYVRLNVSVPTQTTDPATRIYELKVFGT